MSPLVYSHSIFIISMSSLLHSRHGPLGCLQDWFNCVLLCLYSAKIFLSLILSIKLCNRCHGVSRLFHTCHTCSAWSCSHLWREQGASGGPASSGVLRWMQMVQQDASLWAQISLRESGPNAMLMESVSEVLVKNMHTSRAVGHKGADTGHIAGLRPFYGPFELSSCNSLSPGIFTLLRLYWKTQQMAQQPFRNSAYGCFILQGLE